jgi:hypothetical protein
VLNVDGFAELPSDPTQAEGTFTAMQTAIASQLQGFIALLRKVPSRRFCLIVQ